MARRLLSIVASTSVLVACSTEPPPPHHGAPRSPAAAALELGVTPLAVNDRGVPRMLEGSSVAPAPAARAPGSIASARAHVERLAAAWGVARDELPELRPIAEVPATRGTIARLRQVIDGLPIEDGELRVMVGSGGELVLATGTLVGTATPRSAPAFGEPDTAAVARAVAHAYREPIDAAALAELRPGIVAGRAGAIEVQAARAERVWHPAGDALVAAWVVEAYASRAGSTDGDAFRTVIAADGGAVLAHETLTADAAFQYRVFAETTGELHPFDGPIADATPHPTGVPDGSYPPFVTSNLVTVEGLNHPGGQATPDPWLASGRTETLGNNVEAYVDFNPPTGLTFGDFRATVTAPPTQTTPGAFDRAYDTAAHPMSSQDQEMAAITSLFFNINWLHDFWYDAGFIEAAGNAQDNNYGRGGQDRDAILAEAQDNALGGSRNNANMSTPSDGLPPRMQVFLWTGQDDRKLTIAPANRTPAIGAVTWQPGVYDVSAPLALGADATDPVNDACQPLTSSMTGKVVLVDRGGCTAKTKTRNVQAAGGVGAIIANNVAGNPPNFTDDPTIQGIVIGTLTVAQDEGTQLKAELGAGAVTATLHRKLRELDGTLDSTLVAHEYGHYLHHRLNRCSNSICGAMSEGWGDFDSLIAMARPGDNLDGAFPFSVYTTVSFSSDAGYFGIRRAPYSVNPAINALSFRHMGDGAALPTTHPFLNFGTNSEVHNAGEIWAETLWEVYVALHKQPGAVFDAVRAKMKRYVVSGLLMMPVDPSPLEARDALLAVASPDDRPVMLAAFARRGMGSCAVAPAPTSSTFAGIVEGAAVQGRATPGAVTLDASGACDDDGVLDNNETAALSFTLTNTGHVALTDVVVTPRTATPGVAIASPPVTIAELLPGATQTIAVDVEMDGTATAPVIGQFVVAVAAADSCTPSLEVPFVARLNSDEQPRASATDTFDAASIWNPASVAVPAWKQEAETALDSLWHGVDLGVASDTSLISPHVEVGEQPFKVTFSHRYAFEADSTNAYDGGMIEYTTDSGATWVDVATLTGVVPGYTGTLFGGSGNPLAGRAAYARSNPANPGFDTVTLDFGTQLANQDVQLRFRIATDATAGAPGWEIDDVAFTGIAGTPFPALVADDGQCAAGQPGGGPKPQPGGDVDTGCCSASPPRASSLGLALAVLAMLRRRRRSS